jgi:transposase-like protein
MAKRRGREFWQNVVSAYEHSGVSQQAFARQSGVNIHSLRGWLYRLRKEEGEQGEKHGSAIRLVEIEAEAVALQRCRVQIGSLYVELDAIPAPGWIAELACAYEGMKSC